MFKDKKNRNIKGLQIVQEAAKPGTQVQIPANLSLDQPSRQHARKTSSTRTTDTNSSSSISLSDSSPSFPSSARDSLSSAASYASNSALGGNGGGDSNYHNKLSEQLANLEIGVEFKLELRSEDLEQMKELGSGNGGTVSKVKHIPTGLTMARKIVYIDAKPAVRKQILRELQIMHDCHSPYIISFYGAYLHESSVCMAMQLMDKGSFDNIYKSNGPIPVPYLGMLAIAVLSGLTYLYDVHRIMHRDIKPSNILFNSQGQVKICDFGVSGELINSVADTFVGTSTYMSPERIKGSPYTVKSDSWSFGISMIELALGHFPFASEDDFDSDTGEPLDPIDESDEPTLSPVRPAAKEKTLAAANAKKQSKKNGKTSKSSSAAAAKKEKKRKSGVSLEGGGAQMSIFELLQYVVNEPAPTLPEGKFGRDVRDFVDLCLEKDLDKRPTPKELLEKKWLVDVRNDETIDLEAWARTLV